MYAAVPAKVPRLERRLASSTLAKPKSVSLGRSSSPIRMFCGLTSRCTTPAEWAACKASATCALNNAARRK
jgi:hypothetical protein